MAGAVLAPVQSGDKLSCWQQHLLHNTTQYKPERGEDVTRASAVLAPVKSGAKLSYGQQQVEIVAADEILSQADNRRHQRHLDATCQTLELHRSKT